MDALEAMDDKLSILKAQLKFQKNISISLTSLRKLEDDIIATKVAKIWPLYHFIDLIIPQYRNDLMSNLTFSKFVSSFQELVKNYIESVQVLKQEVNELETDMDGVREDMMKLKLKVYVLLYLDFWTVITGSQRLNPSIKKLKLHFVKRVK